MAMDTKERLVTEAVYAFRGFISDMLEKLEKEAANEELLERGEHYLADLESRSHEICTSALSAYISARESGEMVSSKKGKLRKRR